MDQFIATHTDKLQGVLSCFDRVLFRGYLPFFSGAAMASFLAARTVHRRDVKQFVLTQAYRLKAHARQTAAREGRPYQYFGERVKKEDLARHLAERDGIAEGLVCVFATVEPCRTFSLRWLEGAAYIQWARRKCLTLYYYFMDRDFGLIHVRLQTWFPLQLQVYVNGHEWLARKLTRHGIRYSKQDNALPTHCRSRPRSQCGRVSAYRAQRRSAQARCGCAAPRPHPTRRGCRSGFPSCGRQCQYGPWLASPFCGVDRGVLLWGVMPPRQARGQPLHPIFALGRCRAASTGQAAAR